MDVLTQLVSNRILLTLLVSMFPVLELRAAIPLGVSLGMSHMEAFAISVVGNLIPVPFIVLFVRRVFVWLQATIPALGGFVKRLERRAENKKEVVQKWAFWGLVLLVAIPIPGTGAWTGALVAAMMDIRLKKAMPAISAGVVIAGIIVVLVTYGVGGLLG